MARSPSHSPAILLTAYASRQLEHEARAAGVDAFLTKPFAIDQLTALVRAALSDG